jgi:hypothetical protein
MKVLVTKYHQVITISAVLCLTLIATPVNSIKSDNDIFARHLKTIITTDNYAICGITVHPLVPTITDTVQITAGGEWSNSCVPKFESYQMADGEIGLDFRHSVPPGDACAFVFTGWGHTVEIGACVIL